MSTALTVQSLLPVKSQQQLLDAKARIKNTTYVGIDFGTSTTVVSISFYENGVFKVEPIALKQTNADGGVSKSHIIPTIIALYEGNKILVGKGAKEVKYKLRKDENIWYSFKMLFGEDRGFKYPKSQLNRDDLELKITDHVEAAQVFFRYLKKQITDYVVTNQLPTTIEYAVSVPASFEANQRRDLLDSLAANGIEVGKQALIDEPNAAFLSYISQMGEEETIRLPEDYYLNVLVFDFGAGTCDISILEVGQDHQGTYSKNIAISKFDKLGGDDIDRLIAIDVLLPQILDESGKSLQDFRDRELRESIIPKLLPAAERLKILVSKAMSLKAESQLLQTLSFSEEKEVLGTAVRIDTRKGELFLKNPSLSYREFARVMSEFTRTDRSIPAKRIDEEEEFISVFSPIQSALNKAQLDKNEIDILLFIGGSSNNPLVREAVRLYLKEADILKPRDLQAHVSSGAAIHSLILNGFGKNLILPITSEPIILIIKGPHKETVEVIAAAGTTIPTESKRIDYLRPQREVQKVIELPICVGNKEKILYNIKLQRSDNSGFSLSTPVSLIFEINTDKSLLISAAAGDVEVEVEPLSPFVNKEMTTDDRIKFKAEKEFNKDVARHGGNATLGGLNNLQNTYASLGFEKKAAETLEEIAEQYPESSNYNNIGLHYSKAGMEDKALEFYHKAMEKDPCATTAFNIALQYQYSDSKKYKEYLEKAHKLDSRHNPSAFCLGKVLKKEGKEEEGIKLIQDAYNQWKEKFESNSMQPSDFSWFASCARSLGEHDYARTIENSKPERKEDKLYNEENLVSIQSKPSKRLTK